MSPYRTPAAREIVLGPRWGVTFWRKLYVRLTRPVVCLRDKFKEQREWNRYRLDLQRFEIRRDEWKASIAYVISCLCE